MIVNVKCMDARNVGDLYCSPLDYFHFPVKAIQTDLLADAYMVQYLDKDIILGGGGIIHPVVTKALTSLSRRRKAKLISWGIGHNFHGSTKLEYPPYMASFDLHGVRDYGQGYNWVPCVSCMHGEFDVPASVQHDVVIYEHREFPPLPIKGWPRLKNSETDIKKVLDFLKSGSTVLTNTYHGAYWSILLGKKVLAFPFSSKFYGFKYPVPLCEAENWRARLTQARRYPEALEECRESNMRHAARVLRLL